METLKKIKKEYLFIFLILLIPLVSSSNCPNGIYPCDNTIPFVVSIPTTPSSVNYSTVNVNNSNYLDSLDSTEFCRMNYNNSGNITLTDGNKFSSLGSGTSVTHFFAGNGSQNITIVTGVGQGGTGIKWGTGSGLVASATRMIYTPDGD